MLNVIRVSQQQADRSTGVYQVKGGPAGNPDWGLGGHINNNNIPTERLWASLFPCTARAAL